MPLTKRIIALAGLLVVFFSSANAQQWELVDDSELWLAGTSSINSFECAATSMFFDYDVTHDFEGNGFSLPGMALIVPVRDLDCDNRRMNRDMRKTMLSDEHPEIRFEVNRIDLVPESFGNTTTHADLEPSTIPEVEIRGTMAVAGASRNIVIRVSGWLDESLHLHGTGVLDVKMTDFGMEPPRALFGLIKAHDDIQIRFHLIAESAGEIGQALAPESTTRSGGFEEGTGNIQ